MKMSESVTLDHEDRQAIYDYVERRGTVPKADLLTGTEHERRPIAHHVAILKRDGYLEETDDGELRIALDTGAGEAYATDEGIEFTIRPARQEDLAGIVGAIRQVAEELSYIVAETVADELDHEDVLLRHNELESRMFFVATVAENGADEGAPNGVTPREEVVGWAHLNAPELEKLSHTAELTVGIVEGYRGHGIGTHLLERALKWARDNEYEKLYQSVPSTNQRAIDFFESRGWEVEAIREDHYKLGDEYIDEVMMALAL